MRDPVKILSTCSLVVAILGGQVPASADVIPPHIAQAEARLRARPDTYDKVDQFCSGKKRGNACTLPGPAFHGGGAGVCTPRVESEILLTCERQTVVRIDRQIPEGGFVTNDPACIQYREAFTRGQAPAARPMECEPSGQKLTDRFCRDVPTGGACTAEMMVDGRPESHPGICRESTEYKYARVYGGRPMPMRSVTKCEPAERVEFRYTPASWLDKVRH